MLYQTLSHTLKLAPHESPSRRTLNNYAIFYAKPSRKTLNNFGKPSTTLIIRFFLSFAFTCFFFNICFGFLSAIMYPSFPMPIGFSVCRLLSVQNNYPSIAMNLRSGTAAFASFFGTNSFKIPCLNSPLISSSVISSPT